MVDKCETGTEEFRKSLGRNEISYFYPVGLPTSHAETLTAEQLQSGKDHTESDPGWRSKDFWKIVE